MTSIALAPDEALSSENMWDEHEQRWNALIRAGVLPSHVRNAGQAIAIARFGQIYGKDPMWAIHNIHVVEGRCELSAAAMMGMILERARENGDVVTPISMTAERAEIKVQRKGLDPEPVIVEFTIEDAKPIIPGKNGPKTNWVKYPADMLWARCVSRVGRRLYPDVIQGAYVHGEVTGDRADQRVDESFSIEQVDEEYGDTPAPEPDYDHPPEDWEGRGASDADVDT